MPWRNAILLSVIEKGIGVEKSNKIAIRWLEIAAEQGDEFAEEELKKLKE
jgi:TPR repeat protein